MNITDQKTPTPRLTGPRFRLAAAGVLLALALAACGSGADDPATTAEATADTAEATADTAEATADPAEATADPAEVTATPAEAPGDTLVSTGSTDLGDVLVDAAGLTLYGFTNDTDGVPTCEGGCADAWPAVEVASADLPEGLDSAVFSVTERSDGTFQLKAGDWPLYTFSGDAGPGEANGQGSGDVWFAAAPDGTLIQDSDSAMSDEGMSDEAVAEQIDGDSDGDDY